MISIPGFQWKLRNRYEQRTTPSEEPIDHTIYLIGVLDGIDDADGNQLTEAQHTELVAYCHQLTGDTKANYE